MSNLYDQMIERFLSPLSTLNRGVIDALYFLRRDYAFVFTEGYCHPPGGLMGKVMLYPHSEGEVDIFGRPFKSSYKRIENGELKLIPHQEQLAMQFSITPSLDPDAPRPVYSKYHIIFPLTDFKGVFEHRHSLKVAMEIYPTMKTTIADLSKNFSIPLSRLGVTGSTCYGKFEEPGDDIDLVFYGSIEENKKVIGQIKELTRDPKNRVFEFGRFWPIRFYWGKIMICSFFNYSRDEEVPLRDCRIEVLQENVKGVGVVCDDAHSIYMPSIVKLTRLVLEGERSRDLDLIIYDGSLRGEYYEGDYLGFTADRVVVQTGACEFEALLVLLRDDIQRLG